MVATGTSSSRLHIKECDFERNTLFGPFLSCMNYFFIARYKTEKFIAK